MLAQTAPVQIARETKHSQASVDRYIADYQKARLLAQKIPVADVRALTSLSAEVVDQYTELLQGFEPDLTLCQRAVERPVGV